MIVRAGLQALINSQPDMLVIAEAKNGEQAIARFREHRPDVTLMDMRMPVMNGYESVSAIRAEFPEACVVVLSTYSGDEDIRRALLAGARAYLTKDVLDDELITVIRTAHAGKHYLPLPLKATLAAESPRPDLSSRELEVLRLVVDGRTNKQIAHELKIADDTAKNHVKSILRKLGASDRTHAATSAIQRGIIHLRS